jgi:alginate O-acetyltransferase complex protein AlgI
MRLFTELYIIISMVLLSLVFWKFDFSYRIKVIIISIYSIVILATLHIAFILILLCIISLLYYLITLEKKEAISIKTFTVVGLIMLFLVLIIGKYGNSLITALFGNSEFSILVPIGISYFAMKSIAFVVNYRRQILGEIDIIDMIAFIVFLPTFAAGPIENYTSFKNAYIADYSKDDYVYGLRRIAIGYFKKMVITDVIINTYLLFALENSFAYTIPSLQALMPFAKVALIFAKAYFDLSAYTDIAIGFSRLLGFKIAENFNRPFWRRNISVFWRSWHMSLSRWCTSNVYFPVFGLTRKVWMGMYASMIVMGMWHFVNLNWLAWALHHATGLVLFSQFERYKRKRKKLKAFFNNKIVTFFSYLLTFWFVSIGYAFVGSSNIVDGFNVYIAAIKSVFIFAWQVLASLL